MTILIRLKSNVMATEFSEWLQQEMDRRGWNAHQLAKKASLDPGYIGRLLTKERNPGLETLIALAHAFGLPLETLLAEIGVIRQPDDSDRDFEELKYTIQNMPNAIREDVFEYARYKTSQPKPAASIYRILEELARNNPQSILMIVQDRSVIERMFAAERFELVTRGYVSGQGCIVEVIDKSGE